MRRVGAAGHVVAEERLARIDLVELVQPFDGVVGHGGGQIPARLADVRDKWRVVLRNRFGSHWLVSPPTNP